jgi:hypothetical protein
MQHDRAWPKQSDASGIEAANCDVAIARTILMMPENP